MLSLAMRCRRCVFVIVSFLIDLIMGFCIILSILKKISNEGKYDGCDVSCIPGQPPLLQLPEALLRGVELVGEVLYPFDQHPLLLFV